MALRIEQIRTTDAAYQAMLQLRNEVLRKPLGLSLWADDLSKDKDDFLFVAIEGSEIVGCVILKPLDRQTMKLRAMAVNPQIQGTGIGRKLVQEAEATASKMGYQSIEMNARVVAIPFYEKLGYTVISDTFTEVTVPHKKMKKDL